MIRRSAPTNSAPPITKENHAGYPQSSNMPVHTSGRVNFAWPASAISAATRTVTIQSITIAIFSEIVRSVQVTDQASGFGGIKALVPPTDGSRALRSTG